MQEISGEELYDRLVQYGLFSEKLPPVFDGASFLAFCKSPERSNFADKWYDYVGYDSMRNINTPRAIGIPTPMGHERLCNCLKENWGEIQEHFRNTTANQKHIVSRIHIRKMRDTEALFQMNYKNWRVDGAPIPDIALGKRFMVSADISQCFPSIYTHVLPWALVGKTFAKQNSSKGDEWFNQIDHWAQRSKNGETHGILIGPHTSSVLSEIILCRIDEKLCEKWEYIRNIDDFCCYVKTREEADAFLVALNSCLKKYGLALNHKKTEILELPISIGDQWIHQIQSHALYFEKFHPYVDYREIQAFLDFCIELMAQNRENASILLYALKLLQGYTLTNSAKQYLTKTVMSLALIYPYIVPLLDQYVFEPCAVSQADVETYANLIYRTYLPKNYFEACSYALFYAAKYDAKIFPLDQDLEIDRKPALDQDPASDRNQAFDCKSIVEKNDCILSLMALIYCRKRKDKDALKELRDHAKQLKENGELEQQWPFVYECLTVGNLADDWKKMKQKNVSFLKAEYRS